MWSEFALVFCAAFVVSYVPGALLLKSFSFRWFESVVFAPLVSLLAYSALSSLLSIANVPCGWDSIVIPVVLAAVGTCFVSCIIEKKTGRSGRAEASAKDWVVLCLGVGISLAVVLVVFVKNLDGPASFIQEYDNTTHMSVIRVFLETGDYSLFNFTKYISGTDTPVGLASATLYPAVWHCLVAIMVDLAGCDIPLAINAVNSFLSAVVFPAAIMLLVKTIFSDKKMYLASAITAVACGGFPWLFLIFGPLYSNLLAFCLLPLLLAAFIRIFPNGSLFFVDARWIPMFVVACITVSLSQPNALFSAVLFLTPFCVSVIWGSWNRDSGHKRSVVVRLVVAFGFLALVALIWLLLYKAPFMESIVQFTWPALFGKAQAIVNAVSLSFTQMNAAQWLLGFVVGLGVLYSAVEKRYCWVVAAYLSVILIYIVNASTDGELKHLLSGFWYTDTYRIGAMAAIFSVPVACMGLALIHNALKFLFDCRYKMTQHKSSVPLVSAVLALMFLALNYFPNYTDPGNQEVRTGFGAVGERVASLNSGAKPHMLDPYELGFIEEVSRILPEGALVINSPNDGSVFLYALHGINIYYRDLEGDRGFEETSESKIVRNRLDEYAQSSDVRDAISRLDAQYVLLLDQGEGTSLSSYLSNYVPEEWEGIERVTDETPGFEVVLAEGDMRLYRICS